MLSPWGVGHSFLASSSVSLPIHCRVYAGWKSLENRAFPLSGCGFLSHFFLPVWTRPGFFRWSPPLWCTAIGVWASVEWKIANGQARDPQQQQHKVFQKTKKKRRENKKPNCDFLQMAAVILIKSPAGAKVTVTGDNRRLAKSQSWLDF